MRGAARPVLAGLPEGGRARFSTQQIAGENLLAQPAAPGFQKPGALDFATRQRADVTLTSLLQTGSFVSSGVKPSLKLTAAPGSPRRKMSIDFSQAWPG